MQIVTWIAWTLLLAVGASKSDPQAMRWNEFSSKEGEFAVSFPCSPKTTSNPVDLTPTEQTTRWTTVCSSKLGDQAYLVSYFDLAANIERDEETVQALLDAGVESLSTAADHTLLSATPTSYFGFPGRQAEFRAHQFILHMRIFIAERRVYKLLVTRMPGTSLGDQTRFLDSFRLTEPAATPPSP